MKVKYLFLLLVAVLIFSCLMLEQRKVYLDKLQVAKVKMETTNAEDSCAIVDILWFYPSMKRCGIDKEQANLYVCKQESTGDTLYVFAECGPDKALPYFKGVYLAKSSIKNKAVKEVMVSIPENFIIPKKAKYVFSDLLWLED
jgi:hypothetical protein